MLTVVRDAACFFPRKLQDMSWVAGVGALRGALSGAALVIARHYLVVSYRLFESVHSDNIDEAVASAHCYTRILGVDSVVTVGLCALAGAVHRAGTAIFPGKTH